jgi:hypothetical protein
MNFTIFLFALFVATIAAEPMHIVNVCKMALDDIKSAEIDKHTVFSGDTSFGILCDDLLAAHVSERQPMMKCEHLQPGALFGETSLYLDDRWTYVLHKCKKLQVDKRTELFLA